MKFPKCHESFTLIKSGHQIMLFFLLRLQGPNLDLSSMLRCRKVSFVIWPSIVI